MQAFLFINVLEIKELESYDDQEKKGETENEEEKRVKFRFMGPLGKIYNVVVHIRGSTARIAEFIKFIKKIPLDNRTK